MNQLVALVLLALSVNIQAMTEWEKDAVKSLKMQCEETSRVDAAIMKKLRQDGHVANDKNLKEYFYCFLKMVDAFDGDGNLQSDVLSKGLIDMVGKEKANKILNECLEKMGTEEETAFNYMKCSVKYRQGHFSEL